MPGLTGARIVEKDARARLWEQRLHRGGVVVNRLRTVAYYMTAWVEALLLPPRILCRHSMRGRGVAP